MKGFVRLSLAATAIILFGVTAMVWAQSGAGRPFTTTLTGAAEVPAGDPDGTGTAHITLNAGQGEVCWTIEVAGIALPATAAHIHIGTAVVAGPVVIGLSAPNADGLASGCTQTASQDLIRSIIAAPELFYVNVHTTEFPGGAVRGQLSRSP